MNDKIKIRFRLHNPEYFIKNLVRNKIELYSVEKKEKELEIIIKKEDYEKIIKSKTIKDLKIIEYYGLSKLKYQIKKYGLLLLFLGVGVLLNIFLSNIILNVEIETPNQNLKEQVKKDLQELGLKKYRWKISYEQKEKIKKRLLEKEKEKIEWLEIEEQGTKYIVKVEEKKLREAEMECTPRNIISRKNAIITKIESSSGEIIKKKQDYVTKGEVLISGFIYNKETIVSKKCAIGKVYGETWYKVIVEVPKEIKKEEKTNQDTWAIHLKILEKETIFPNKYKNYKKTEYNIIERKIIPVSFGVVHLQKIKKEEENYTLNNVDEKALEEAIRKLEERLKEKPNIIRKNVLKKTVKNSKIIVEVFFAIEEDITDYQDISELDIEQMNQEKE